MHQLASGSFKSESYEGAWSLGGAVQTIIDCKTKNSNPQQSVPAFIQFEECTCVLSFIYRRVKLDKHTEKYL